LAGGEKRAEGAEGAEGAGEGRIAGGEWRGAVNIRTPIIMVLRTKLIGMCNGSPSKRCALSNLEIKTGDIIK